MSALSADAAHTPMPHSHHTDPDARAQRVPIGLFLPGPRGASLPPIASPDLPDWQGLSALGVAQLIGRYTRPGDTVLALDAHPAIAAACGYLDRATGEIAGNPQRIPAPAHRAALLLAPLPRPGLDSADLHGLVAAFQQWRPTLRPGGFLLVALTVRPPAAGSISERSTVITAARAAGFLYHQHLPIVLAPLPDQEPRTDPSRELSHPMSLPGGRHRVTHRDLLAFAVTTTPSKEANRG
ncbi:hypothetical protein [Asanoa siamensis]|uniref:Uncharacterized protein n=1 Tax=Asanoa siamensis TaxID=926357 RepID=A0ABQ4CS40_9ACTN|nr:hypothetical protein [Asanoa siamensis]GIF74105.1 hypothetical protein Asi02nite_36230 [Asanoa siamensis]